MLISTACNRYGLLVTQNSDARVPKALRAKGENMFFSHKSSHGLDPYNSSGSIDYAKANLISKLRNVDISKEIPVPDKKATYGQIIEFGTVGVVNL